MNNKTNLKTFIIIGLIVIIISVIYTISNIKNSTIEKQKIAKEQLEATTNNNAYITLKAHNSELNSIQQEINNIQNIARQATATASQILKDYTAYKDGKLITGTMPNNGAVSATLNAGENYVIPASYHNGSGKVTANSLASQTSATATTEDIASGKTAYVNGNKITGTAKKSQDLEIALFNDIRVDYSTTSRTLNLNPGKYIIITGVGNGGSYNLTINGAEKIIQFSTNGSIINDTIITSPLTFDRYSEPHLKIESNNSMVVTLKQTSGASGNYSNFIVIGYTY